jgi:hypothetical protein
MATWLGNSDILEENYRLGVARWIISKNDKILVWKSPLTSKKIWEQFMRLCHDDGKELKVSNYNFVIKECWKSSW